MTGANLQRLDLATGAIQPLTELRGFVTSWSREGVILAVEDYVIKQLAASGGTPKPVTELDHSRGEFVHTFARFLPDGRHFLFHARTTSSNPSDWAVYVGAINDLKFRKLLLQGTGPATYAPPGWLLFTLDDALLAQPFDAHTLQFTGERALVADHVDTNAYAVSETGSLVWRAGSSRKVAQLTWFDRTGKILEKIGEPGEIANPVLSPDGKRVLITIRDPVARTRDIWIMNLERGTKSRLTFDAAEDYNPVWSSDGAYVVFSSSRKGKHDIYRKRADGVGGEEELLASDLDKSVDSLSPDGKFVLYNIIEAGKPISIWELPLGADHKPVPIVAGPRTTVNSRPTAAGSLTRRNRSRAKSSCRARRAPAGRPESGKSPSPVASCRSGGAMARNSSSSGATTSSWLRQWSPKGHRSSTVLRWHCSPSA